MNIHLELPEETILLSRQDLKAELKELLREMHVESSMDAIMTIKETAVFMKVSVPTIRTLIASNEIPYFQRGQVIRLDRCDVLDWMKNNSKR